VSASDEVRPRRYDTPRASVYSFPWPLDGDTRTVYVRNHVEDDHAGDYDVGEAAEATLDALEGVAWRVEDVDILDTPAWPVTAEAADADEATETDTEQRHEVATDGGRHRLTEGSIVVDEDSEDDDLLEVVEVYHNDRADDWRIEALDATVAEANPHYPPGDAVVVAVYREDVLDAIGSGAPPEFVQAAAARDQLRTYSFPRSRLRATGGGDE
jgi:hypothetical protein